MNIIPNEQNLDLKSHTRLGGVFGPSYTLKEMLIIQSILEIKHLIIKLI